MKYQNAADFYLRYINENNKGNENIIESICKASFNHLYNEFVKECMYNIELNKNRKEATKYSIYANFNPGQVQEISTDGILDKVKYDKYKSIADNYLKTKEEIENKIKDLKNKKNKLNFLKINKQIRALEFIKKNKESINNLMKNVTYIMEVQKRYGINYLKQMSKECNDDYEILLSSIASDVVRNNIDKYPAILIKDHIDYLIDKPLFSNQEEIYPCGELIEAINVFKKEFLSHLDEYTLTNTQKHK